MNWQVENNMNGVERLLFYANHISSEGPFNTSPDSPPSDWPSNGTLKVQDLVLRYRSHLPPALNGVSFTANAGEHVALVGRTGAGKSSGERRIRK